MFIIFLNNLLKILAINFHKYFKNDKDLDDIIINYSIDKISLINLIHLLNPLNIYLKGLNLNLKKYGFIFFARKFDPLKIFDENTFQNKQIDVSLINFKKIFKFFTNL